MSPQATLGGGTVDVPYRSIVKDAYDTLDPALCLTE